MRSIFTVKSKLIVTAAVALLTCALSTMALNTGLAHAQVRVISSVKNSIYAVPVPVYLEVEKPAPAVTPIEVVRPVYVEKEVEVPREIPVTLKDWDSPEQLGEFLKNDDTDRRLILQADGSGEVSFNGQCEDLALQLRDRAMAVGRYLSVQVLNPGEYYKWYGRAAGPDVYHAIGMARIGNQFWYIEPATDKYWRALNLD